MAKLIVVVDDEQDILDLVSHNLLKAGYEVRTFTEPEVFLDFLKKQIPDAVILDLMLPGMDGYEVCKLLRREKQYARIPVIMLTAKGEESDKVIGLELGADDYVTKPFSMRELLARVKALLRRNAPEEKLKKVTLDGNITIDPERYEVIDGKKKIVLTTTEFKILYLLSSRKGIVFSRDQILDHLWGDERAIVDRTVDVHIKNLRDKLGTAGEFIKNVRGVGYKVEE